MVAGRPRDRATTKGLLNRMEARVWRDGKTITYRYHPFTGKPINLGQDRIVASRKVLDMLGAHEDTNTLKWVWERFSCEEPTASPRWKRLAAATKADYRQAWQQIEKSFGAMQIGHIDATMVARYVHIERAAAPRRANIEKALLSNLFGHGIKLGACKVNATIGVEPHLSEARTKAPDEKVLSNFLGWLANQSRQRQVIGMAAEYSSLAGNRQAEFLPLTWPQIDRNVGVVRIIRAKQRGGKRDQIVEVISIGRALSTLLDRLEAIRQNDCLFVFPNRGGNQYSAKGFKTLWHRCVTEAIKDQVLSAGTRFTFHDLRSHYASKHKRDTGVLPDLHKNPETTARIYDRNKEVRRDSL